MNFSTMFSSNTLLITGANGGLGTELMKIFPDAVPASLKEFDITDRNLTRAFIKRIRPGMVIHLAALTDVAKCEHERNLAWATNVRGTENIADALSEFAPDAYFLYLSTAVVFKGDKGNYKEDDVPDPVNFYGLTKLIGEFVARKLKNHLIVRTNFVPRVPWKHKRAFVDRWGTYLFANDVACGIKDIMGKRLTGTIHLCGDRKISMFELAAMVSPGILPITMEEYYATNDVHLTQDMTLRSTRIPAYKIT